MTFLREVISAARAELGPDRLIGVRMYDTFAPEARSLIQSLG